MRYIGGKTLLLDKINSVICSEASDTRSIIDCFAGSGVVSNELKKYGYSIICNDNMYFSSALSRGNTCVNEKPTFSNLHISDPIEYLNNMTFAESGIDIEDCFIYKNYSPNNYSRRMYFQTINALKIDIIRITIGNWLKQNKITEEEFYYLLASLIESVPSVSNIAGTYGAYLKHWDKRTFKSLKLEHPNLIKSSAKCVSYNEDVFSLLSHVEADLLYADPPYNQRQYLPNYHILETIAKYDYPKINGVTGVRSYEKQKSEFCSKNLVKDAFEKLISKANVKYVLISYNSDGIMSKDDIELTMRKYSTKPSSFRYFEYPYRRYMNKHSQNNSLLYEQLYFIKK